MEEIAQKFFTLCEQPIAAAGYQLLRVSWKNHELCFYIDQAAGIGHEDCAKITHLIEPLVENNDQELGENYNLSVSSEGADGKDWEE